jgi:hypothetical protein
VRKAFFILRLFACIRGCLVSALNGCRRRDLGSRLPPPKMWTELPVCCPEGTNDGSQAIYCLERNQSRIRPVGHGLIPTPSRLIVLVVARLSDPTHTVPYGTVPVFARIPGNKLPGHFHNVPTGQRHLTPVHEFGATSPGVADSRTRTRTKRLYRAASARYHPLGVRGQECEILRAERRVCCFDRIEEISIVFWANNRKRWERVVNQIA